MTTFSTPNPDYASRARLTVPRSDIFAISGGDEKLVATALVTLMLLEGGDDVAEPATAT